MVKVLFSISSAFEIFLRFIEEGELSCNKGSKDKGVLKLI